MSRANILRYINSSDTRFKNNGLFYKPNRCLLLTYRIFRNDFLFTLFFFAFLSFNQASSVKAFADSNKSSFRVGVYSISKSFDPASILDLSNALLSRQIFYYLYRFNHTNDLQPEAVLSHSIQNEGRKYTINLRRGLYFADGSEITAADVVYTVNRVLRKNGASMAWALGSIIGYEDSVKSIHKAFIELRGVRIVGQFSFEINLKEPFRDILQTMATPYFGIVKKGTALAVDVMPNDQYLIKRHSPDRIVLIPHGTNRLANLGLKLEFVKIGSPFVAYNLASQGLLDFIFPVIETHVPEGFQKLSIDSLNIVIVQFNTKKAAFNTKEKRCDFAKKFNQTVKNIPQIGQRIRVGLPFTTGIFNDNTNSEKIYKVLPNNQKLKSTHTLSLDYIDSVAVFGPNDLKAIEKQMNIYGYKIKFKKRPLSDFLNRGKKGDFDLALWGYGLDYFSPDALLTPLLGSDQQYNFSRFSDDKYDERIKRVRLAQSDDDRAVIYSALFRQVDEMCPVIFLGTQKHSLLVAKEFSLITPPSSIGVHTYIFSETIRRTH